MKTLLILFASVLAASAITVTIPLKDFRVQSPAARDCIITPMTLAPTNGVVPIYDPWPAASDADGIVTLDSMMPGTYQLDVLAPPRNTTVYFLVDPTNQVQNAATNLIAQTNHVFPGNGYAWSAQASDLRYVRTGTGSDYVITNNWKGAPLVFDARNWSTNAYGGKLIILGDGSSRIQGQGASAINSASTAFGYATASGLASTAFGLNSVASGRDSLAFAYGVASGEDSFAGVYATASGYKSIALGQYSQATNDYSFVWSSAPNFINDNGDMVAVGVGSDSNYTFTVSAPAFRFLNGTIYGDGSGLTGVDLSGAAVAAATAVTNNFPWSSMYDPAGAAQSATNALGTAAWQSIGSFDAAGSATSAAQAATNGLASGAFNPKYVLPSFVVTNPALFQPTNVNLTALANIYSTVLTNPAPFQPSNNVLTQLTQNVVTNNNIVGFALYGNTNTYIQIKVRNFSAGTNASSDFVAEADNGSETNYYVNLGINGSGYFPTPQFYAGATNDAYLYVVGSSSNKAGIGGNFYLETFQSNSIISFLAGTTNQSVIVSNGTLTTTGGYVGNGAGLTNLNLSAAQPTNNALTLLAASTLSSSNGVSLTNLNASNIASGTINAARLPAATNVVVHVPLGLWGDMWTGYLTVEATPNNTGAQRAARFGAGGGRYFELSPNQLGGFTNLNITVYFCATNTGSSSLTTGHYFQTELGVMTKDESNRTWTSTNSNSMVIQNFNETWTLPATATNGIFQYAIYAGGATNFWLLGAKINAY